MALRAFAPLLFAAPLLLGAPLRLAAQQPATVAPASGQPPVTNPVPPSAVMPGVLPQVGSYRIIPGTTPELTPAVLHLLELEGQFADAVAAGGGKAFATWFAEDAVVLNNGKPAILGRGALATEATWDPKSYQLSWIAEGAQAGASNDMGFTWGRYTGRTLDSQGHTTLVTGRYITIWKKQANGAWKVALDASANAPEQPGT